MPASTNTPTIPNALASPDLDAVELVDPARIAFYTHNLAEQVNKFRMSYAPQKRVIDLEDWIADIIIETSAQGSSILEVHVIDPAWTLFQRDQNGVCFIDADETGYLWPPIEVTFPQDISDATWRLVGVRPSTDLTQPNVILIFEDKIVSELREHFGAQNSGPNQTRAEFIQMLIKQANKSPAYPGEVDIRFVPLLPKSTFTVQDLSMSERIPKSAKQSNPPNARKDANKGHRKTAARHASEIPGVNNIIQAGNALQQGTVNGTDISIRTGLGSFTNIDPSPFAPVTPIPANAALGNRG